MMLRPGMVTPKASASASAVIAPVDLNKVDLTNGSSYTFSSVSLGDAQSAKAILLAIGTYRAAAVNITGVTVAGQSATECIAQASTNRNKAAIYIVNLADPSLTSGDVTITFSANVVFCTLDVYAVTGPVNLTPFDTAGDGNNSSQSESISLDVPANGFAIASCAWQQSSGNHVAGSSAYKNFSSAQTGLAIGFTGVVGGPDTWSGLTAGGHAEGSASVGANQCQLCAASFGPGGGESGVTKQVVMTSGTEWTVPDDWNSDDNTIEVIEAGQDGTAGGSGSIGTAGGGGDSGKGGDLAGITNFSATPGSTLTINIGQPGASPGSTWLSNTGVAPTSISEGVLASASGSIGDYTHSGAPALDGQSAPDASHSGSGAAGGGAAGNNGNASGQTPGDMDPAWDDGIGPGTGGNAGSGGSLGAAGSPGGDGGNYGGGGGGGGGGGRGGINPPGGAKGLGAPGVIVIRYTPT